MRRGRTPLANRVRQCLTAFEVLRTKGALEFTASQVAGEIDQRLPSSAVYDAFYSLQEKGVLSCVTPGMKSHRHWRVTNWDKARAYLYALDRGQEFITPAMPAHPAKRTGLFVGLWHLLFGRRDREARDVERRLSALEARFTDLLKALGEDVQE